MKIQTIAITNDEGKRNVKVANGLRAQMFDKIVDVLTDAGFEVEKGANGDICIKTCVDTLTSDVFYTRLAVSLSNKPLDAKVEKKHKAKPAEDVVIPELFGDEDE